MEIPKNPGDPEIKAYTQESGESRRTDAADSRSLEKKTHPQKGDTVQLSTASREMQLARNAVNAAPEIRADKVEGLQKSVEDGSYSVDADQVAEKFIKTILEDIP